MCVYAHRSPLTIGRSLRRRQCRRRSLHPLLTLVEETWYQRENRPVYPCRPAAAPRRRTPENNGHNKVSVPLSTRNVSVPILARASLYTRDAKLGTQRSLSMPILGLGLFLCGAGPPRRASPCLGHADRGRRVLEHGGARRRIVARGSALSIPRRRRARGTWYAVPRSMATLVLRHTQRLQGGVGLAPESDLKWMRAAALSVPDGIESAMRPSPSAGYHRGNMLFKDSVAWRELPLWPCAALRCGKPRAHASRTSHPPHPSSGTARRTRNTIPCPSPHPLTACALAPCAQLDAMVSIDRRQGIARADGMLQT